MERNKRGYTEKVKECVIDKEEERDLGESWDRVLNWG